MRGNSKKRQMREALGRKLWYARWKKEKDAWYPCLEVQETLTPPPRWGGT